MKVKNDHHSEFSDLSNFFRLLLSNCLNWKIHCEDHSSLSSITAVHFIYTYIISLLTGRYELNKLTSLPMCGFIAQLVEHRTGIAEVTGSNPAEVLIFFRLLLSSCFNWKIHCKDHSSLSSITAVHMNYIDFICHYILYSQDQSWNFINLPYNSDSALPFFLII